MKRLLNPQTFLLLVGLVLGFTCPRAQGQENNPCIDYISQPSDISQYMDMGQCYATVSFTVPEAMINCASVTVLCSPSSGSQFPLGSTSVTCVGSDGLGPDQQCGFTVTVIDGQPPNLACPSDMTVVIAEGSCSAIVSFDTPTATDNCTASPTVLCDPPTGSELAKGFHLVACIASDAAGNGSYCSFTVTVNDGVNPIVTCPADITTTNDPGSCTAHVEFTFQATANCVGPAVSASMGSGSAFTMGTNTTYSGSGEFPVGTNTVYCNASDAAGNSANCSFTITVLDKEPPNMSCFTNMSVAPEANSCSAVVEYPVGLVTDNCSGTVDIFCSPTSGSRLPKGIINVTCIAWDAAGNSTNCSFSVTVNDGVYPTVSCPEDILTINSVTSCTARVELTFTGTGNCDYPEVLYTAVTGSAPGMPSTSVALALHNSTNWINNSGYHKTYTIGGDFPIGSNIVRVEARGTLSDASREFKVVVMDCCPATLVCPSNLTRRILSTWPWPCSAMVMYDTPLATGNCHEGLSVICDPPSGSVLYKGVYPVNCHATDAVGNVATCGFTITVEDGVAPALFLPDITTTNDTGDCGAFVPLLGGAWENCGEMVTVECWPPQVPGYGYFRIGTNAVRCSATDAAGNRAEGTFTVTVLERPIPTLRGPANITATAVARSCSAVVTYPLPTVTNLCWLGAQVVCVPPSGAIFQEGVTPVNCTAVSWYSNTIACSFTVSVRPSLLCSDITMPTDPGACAARVTFTNIVVGNCAGVVVVCVPESGALFPVGSTPVSCTATDAAGNSNQCSFTVTVADTEKPQAYLQDFVVGTDPGSAYAWVEYFSYPVGLGEDWGRVFIPVADNCPCNTPPMICSPPSGSYFRLGVSSVVCEFWDASCNSDTVSFTITVLDLESPSIHCPTNMVWPANPGQTGTNVNYALPHVTDNCEGWGTGWTTVVCDPPPGSLFPLGTTTITCSALDASGNSVCCSFPLIVTTNLPPVANASKVTLEKNQKNREITLTGSDPNSNMLFFAVDGWPDTTIPYTTTNGGTLIGTPPNLYYTPPQDFTGGDCFTFTVSDGGLVSAPATVSLAVGCDPLCDPLDTVVTYGQNATFWVVLGNVTNPHYYWQKHTNGTSTHVGGDSPILVVTNPAAAESGTTYDVLVTTNGSPLATSSQATLTVNPAVLWVCADDIIRFGGQADGTLSYTLRGFVLGETASNLVTGQPVLASTADTTSPPGTYAISVDVGTVRATNYLPMPQNGFLTVVGAPTGTTGTDFWTAFIATDTDSVDSLQLSLASGVSTGATVHVTFPASPSLDNTFVVGPGEVRQQSTASDTQFSTYNVATDVGIHVQSDTNISLYGFSYESLFSEAFLCYPTPMLGTHYCVMACQGLDMWMGHASSEFTVVATESNTLVTIIPSPSADLRERSAFEISDILDLSGLVSKLRQTNSAFVTYLRGCLTTDTDLMQLLNAYPSTDSNSTALATALLAKFNGILQTSTNFYEKIPSTFFVSDFTNLPSLASKLKLSADSVSTYLKGRLSAETLTALTNYDGLNSDPVPLQTALSNDFNGIIGGESLYDSARFSDVTLRSETQQLRLRNPKGVVLVRLNRFLLEDAYPLEIARHQNAFAGIVLRPDTQFYLEYCDYSTDKEIGSGPIDQGQKDLWCTLKQAIDQEFYVHLNRLLLEDALRPLLSSNQNPFTVRLDRGQAYQVRSNPHYYQYLDNTNFARSADVTGTFVDSTPGKPVAIIAGSQSSFVPAYIWSGNPQMEQQIPVSYWGTQVLGFPLATRGNGDIYRVLAAQDYTVVYLNGEAVANLQAGQFCDLTNNGVAQFEASRPIQVAQFSTGTLFDMPDNELDYGWGDPFELLLPPTGHYLNSYTILSPSSFSNNFINLVIERAAISNTCIDTIPVTTNLFIPIGRSGYYGTQVSVSPGTHTVTGPRPLCVTAYGFSPADGYGYVGGFTNFFFSAMPDCFNVSSNVATTVDVLANDGVGNKADLTLSIVTGPTNGSYQLITNGNLIAYTPSNGFSGEDHFTYQIAENNASATALVTLWINNRPPQAQSFTIVTANPFDVTINLTNQYVTDPDQDPISLQSLGPARFGSVRMNLNNTISYRDYGRVHWDNDQFTYTVTDGRGGTATGRITIAPASHLYTSPDLTNVVRVGQSNLISVLQCVTHDFWTTLTLTNLSGPQHGEISIGRGATNIIYTPNPTYRGRDTFLYTVFDGIRMAVGFVAVNVEGPPLILTQPLSQTVYVGNTVHLSVRALSDTNMTYRWCFNGRPLTNMGSGNTLSITNVTAARSGEFSVVVSNCYGSVTSAVAVLSVEQTIIAHDDFFKVLANSRSNCLNVLTNDTDTLTNALAVGVFSNTLAVICVTNPAAPVTNISWPTPSCGCAVTNLFYTPPPGFTGVERFYYFVSNAYNQKAWAAVTIAVLQPWPADLRTTPAYHQIFLDWQDDTNCSDFDVYYSITPGVTAPTNADQVVSNANWHLAPEGGCLTEPRYWHEHPADEPTIGLSSGTTYAYVVVGHPYFDPDALELSNMATNTPTDTNPVPANLVFQPQASPYDDSVFVEWKVPSTNSTVTNTLNQTNWQFYVERKLAGDDDTNYVTLTEIGYDLCYMDCDVTNDASYVYRVAGVRSADYLRLRRVAHLNVDSSTETNITPSINCALRLFPPVAGNGYVDLVWSQTRAASYTVLHSLSSNAATLTPIAQFFTNRYQNPQNSFRDVHAANGKTNYYRIAALSPDGCITNYSTVQGALPSLAGTPLPPQNFQATPRRISNQVFIVFTWDAVPGATGYQAFLRDGAGLHPLTGTNNAQIGWAIAMPPGTTNGSILDIAVRLVSAAGNVSDLAETSLEYCEPPAEVSQSGPVVVLKIGGWTPSNPAESLNITGPTNLTISADASLPYVRRVDFYADSGYTPQHIGSCQQSPYQVTWFHVPGGSFTVRAVVSTGGDPVHGGQTYTASAGLQVNVKPELAAYQTSVTDLQLPAPGLPLTLSRSYSSRDTGQGGAHLAVGWLASWKMPTLKLSASLTNGWAAVEQTRNLFGWNCWYVNDAAGHAVTVTLPNGQSAQFGLWLYNQTDRSWLERVPLSSYMTTDEDAANAHIGIAFAPYTVNQGSLADSAFTALTLKCPNVDPDDDLDSWQGAVEFDMGDPAQFTYTGSDGTVYVYGQKAGDLTWLLTRIVDRNSNSLTYSYGLSGFALNQVTAITNSCGRGIRLDYPSLNEVQVFDSSSTNPAIKYLTTSGQLLEAHRLVDRSSSPPVYDITHYSYGNSGWDSNRLTDVYDPRGVRLLHNAYTNFDGNLNSAGDLLTQVDAAGRTTQYNYTNDATGPQVTVWSIADGVTTVLQVAHDTSGAVSEVTTPTQGTAPDTQHTAQNTYDERGRLIASTDANGHTTTYMYDSQDRLVGQSDPAGNATSLDLNAYGQPTSTTDAKYHQTIYQYDNCGNVIYASLPAGTTTTSAYANVGVQTSGLFAGNLLAWETNSDGAGGNRIVKQYFYETDQGKGLVGDLKLTIESPTDAAGNSVGTSILNYYEYDAFGNCTAQTRVRTTNGNGAVQCIRTTSKFDAQNRVTETEVLCADSPTATGWTPVTNTHTYTTYNKLGRVATSTDGYGRVTTSVYDFAGNLIETVAPDGTVARTVFDQKGHAVWVQDRCRTNESGITVGPATRMTYDASGRVVKTERCGGLTLQRVSAASNTNCVRLSQDYDSQVMMTVVTNAPAPTVLTTTRSFYDVVGRLHYSVDARGNVTEYVYDAAGRRTASILYTEYFFDPATAGTTAPQPPQNASGETTTFTYDANGNQTSVTGAAGHTTTSEYDAGNRVKAVHFPATSGNGVTNRTTLYDGWGRKVQETDEAGVTNTYGYDLRGLLTSVTVAANTAQAATYLYTYDEVGNLVTQIDPLNHTNRFQYDELGRRTARTLPDGSTETTTYGVDTDPVGSNVQVLKKILTDFNNRITTQYHDRMDRLVINQLPAITHQDQGNTVTDLAATTVTYEYTIAGQRARVVQSGGANRTNLYAYDSLGNLRAISTPEGTLSYAKDQFGGITGISARYGYSWASPMPADGYLYDQTFAGSQTLVHGNGAEWNYAYDVRGRLLKVNSDQTGTNADAAYTYDSVGNLSTLTQRNGIATTYSYNERNWLRLVDTKTVNNQATLAQFDYDGAVGGVDWTMRHLSPVGQRQRVVEMVGGTSRAVEYYYDPLRRLVNETIVATNGPSGSIYYNKQSTNSTTQGYDLVGNRFSRKVSDTSLTAVGVTDYEGNTFDSRDRLQTGVLYDRNGNTTNYTVGGQTALYVYDAEDRLVKQTGVGDDVTVVYDADGNRVQKTVGSTTTYYLVEALNPSGYVQVMEERTALTGDPTVTYVYGLALISQKRGTTTNFYGCDGLGSVRYLTAADGSVTDTYTYDAFGIQIGSTGSTPNNYRYTAQQWDAHLGMYYLRARYYRPELGRFWTIDSFEGSQSDPLSLHKYLYCKDNPANRMDPSGHDDLNSMNLTGALQAGLFAIRTGFVATRAYLNAQKLLSYTIVFGGLAWAGYERYIAPGMAGFETTDGRWGAIKYFAPSSDLTALLQRQSDTSVRSFTMTGHADSDYFEVGTDTLLISGSDGNYSMLDRNGTDIIPVLNRVLEPNASITLYGCHSGELARKLSTVFTRATVYGFTSYIMGANAFGVNSALCTFGSRTLYVNGSEVKNGQ